MESFESIFAWLDIGNRPIPPALRSLLQKAHSQAENSKTKAALATLKELEQTATDLGDAMSQARAALESARVELKLQDPTQALLELRKAIEILEQRCDYDTEYRHFRFIASWLLGIMLWPASGAQALAAWQSSLDDVHSLWRLYKHLVPEGDWYYARQEEMKRQIDQAIQAGRSYPASPAWKSLPFLELHSSKNRVLPIVGEIPAGRTGPWANDVEPIDEMEVPRCADEFMLDNHTCRLLSLRSAARGLALSPSRSYYILKVSGDSMDLAGIQDGNYVLMRAQNVARNGDIVAAEVIDVDPRATLKYFSRQRDQAILRPQSTNPSNKTFEFLSTDHDRFFIRGIGLGVFKPS